MIASAGAPLAGRHGAGLGLALERGLAAVQHRRMGSPDGVAMSRRVVGIYPGDRVQAPSVVPGRLQGRAVRIRVTAAMTDVHDDVRAVDRRPNVRVGRVRREHPDDGRAQRLGCHRDGLALAEVVRLDRAAADRADDHDHLLTRGNRTHRPRTQDQRSGQREADRKGHRELKRVRQRTNAQTDLRVCGMSPLQGYGAALEPPMGRWFELRRTKGPCAPRQRRAGRSKGWAPSRAPRCEPPSATRRRGDRGPGARRPAA